MSEQQKNTTITINHVQEEASSSTSSSSARNMDAHLIGIGTVNRENVLAAPQIDNIIEEEEEEEKEELDEVENKLELPLNDSTTFSPTKTAVSNINNSNENSPLIQQIKSHDESNIRFILEPVLLDPITIQNANESTDNNNNNINSPNLNQSQPAQEEIKKEEEKGSDEKNEEEIVEIKVEEGYATRQMDEYFRQTIEAIKEELTRKLENQNGDENNPNENIDLNEVEDQLYDGYDTESEIDSTMLGDSDYLDHELLDSTNGQEIHLSSPLSQNQSKNTRNLLYRQILTLSNKKLSKSERINTLLVMFACFLNNFIIEGLCYNYANLFKLIETKFELQSKLIACMPGQFLIIFFLLFAPIAVYFSKQYGEMRIALVGTFMSAISLFISSFIMNDIVLFSLFYGVFTGN
jgi:hypothetical protein